MCCSRIRHLSIDCASTVAVCCRSRGRSVQNFRSCIQAIHSETSTDSGNTRFFFSSPKKRKNIFQRLFSRLEKRKNKVKILILVDFTTKRLQKEQYFHYHFDGTRRRTEIYFQSGLCGFSSRWMKTADSWTESDSAVDSRRRVLIIISYHQIILPPREEEDVSWNCIIEFMNSSTSNKEF